MRFAPCAPARRSSFTGHFERVQEKRLSKAVARAALTKQPDSAHIHVLFGEVMDAAGQIGSATEEIEAAAKAPTVPPEAHFGLGYLYWKQQRYEEASREFQAELKNQPQNGQALAYLGDVEMRLDHEQSATELLKRALAVDSNLRLAHLDLGILLSGKDSSGAARHFREAIRIDPSKPDAHYRLGWLLSSLGRDEEAQAEFEQVKKLAAQEPPPPLIRLPGRKLP